MSNSDSNMGRKRRSPEEQAEFEAMMEELPEFRRLKEAGHSFDDVWDSKNMKPLNPLPTEEEMERMVPDSTVESIVSRAFAKAGHRYVPKAEREAVQPMLVAEEEDDDEDRPRIFHFPRIPRQFTLNQMAGLLAASVVIMVGGQLGVSYMRHQQTGLQMAQERVHLHTTVHGRTLVQTGGPTAPRTFDINEADIHGVLREGSLELEEVGSAADSMVHGTLSLLGDVVIEIGDKSPGMAISTPTADVELLEPGKYAITAPDKDVGYVTVIQGLATVDDRGTPLDKGKARTGQTIKTRPHQLPTRNMREP